MPSGTGPQPVCSSFLYLGTHFLPGKGWGEHILAILGAYRPTKNLFVGAILATTLGLVLTGQGHCYKISFERRLQSCHPCPHGSWAWQGEGTPTHHIFDLAVPIAEDDGIRGIAHRQHHCKGDAHGDWDQGVEGVNVQRFRLEERIHRNIHEISLAFPVLNVRSML